MLQTPNSLLPPSKSLSMISLNFSVSSPGHCTDLNVLSGVKVGVAFKLFIVVYGLPCTSVVSHLLFGEETNLSVTLKGSNFVTYRFCAVSAMDIVRSGAN